MLYTPKTIEAFRIADVYHRGQIDKSGAPYIIHLYRVADSMVTEAGTVTALLHDLLEDTDAEENVLSPFSQDIQEAVRCLTRGTEERYFVYIERVKQNPLARKVKIADIQDHLRPELRQFISESLQKRYQQALAMLH